MTRNIVDIIKEKAMSDTTCTEKAQIIVTGTGVQNIFRFSSLKKGEKAYRALILAWDKYHVKQAGRLYDVDGDMYVGVIDFATTLSVCFVDIAKRSKFVPYQG